MTNDGGRKDAAELTPPPLRWSLSCEGQVRTPMVVLVLPAPQFSGELGGRAKRGPAIKLVLVSPVARSTFPLLAGHPGEMWR
jgi:hypothetical protein